MKIVLGHRVLDFPEGTTLEKVIGPNEATKIYGIYVNKKRIPCEEFSTYVLHDNDKIKIMRVKFLC